MTSKSHLKLVSFDSGGIRGLSQLEIMRSIMHRLNWDKKLEQRMLPCEYFNLIGGAGTGGLIAMLLTKLRMSVEEASDEFYTIIEEVYGRDYIDPQEKTSRLRQCLEEILKRNGLPLNMLLVEETQVHGCSGFTVASPRTNANSTLCLRTYPVRSQPPSNITLIEAVLATCAAQPDFTPVSSGSGFRKREYIAAARASNPIYEVINEAHLLFGGNAIVVSLLSLGAGHPGAISFPSSGGEVSLHRAMREMMEDCEQRAQEFKQRMGRIEFYSRFSVEQGMQNDIPALIIDPNWINTQTEDYLNSHETCESLDLFAQEATTQTVYVTLDQLKHAGGPNSSGQLALSVERSLEILISNQDDAIISKLKPIDGVEYGPHIMECMEGTRRDIVARIDTWANNAEAPNILLLKGYPGVGKSAISATVVERWRSLGRLSSSFFFRRESAHIMTPQTLWRAVAYDLARQHSTFRKQLVTSSSMNESLLVTSNVDTLFRQLIHDPLLASDNIMADALPVVVVDALDECGGLDGQYSDYRKGLMRTLKCWSTLPRRFKLFVTSRAENDIEKLFSQINHYPLEIRIGRKVDPSSEDDILAFFRHELQQIVRKYPSLPLDWPGSTVVKEMTIRAAGLFIWAKTLMKLLERGEPRGTLDQVLATGVGGMTPLYTWILKTAFPNPRENDIQNFRSILGAIIFAKAPLDIKTLGSLLSIEASVIEYICSSLQSVLEWEDTLRIHHQSFVDFLVDPMECPPIFLIEQERENRAITLACLQTMKNHLQFNICGIKSSYVRNYDIPDLASRVEKCISRPLLYASFFWTHHLAETTFDKQIFDFIQYFMHNHFLFWLEILSLTKRVNLGSSMLHGLIEWMRKSDQDGSLATDMQKFLANFASVISQSVPHIYLSALPFAPRQLAVSRQYVDRYPQTLAIRCGGPNNWPVLQNILIGHSEGVSSASFSPDGRRIVSGSDDWTIRIWDAETGETVIGPLEGHSNKVTSVSFSSDGARIVSGSWDSTIRVWDVQSGGAVIVMLQEHSGGVTSASFSPDGSHIVSGAYNGTVRVWDTEEGGIVVRPWRGHTKAVTSASFSPDGRHIVSSSGDTTIRMWNAETGGALMNPLEGHSKSVNSVSFSSDGQYIVSSSSDNTIRVWDTETGQTVRGPLERHGGSVTSASFSPDGIYIVSSSSDGTVRVWVAKTGKMATDTLKGHHDSVSSVSFSMDGRSIVSSSQDKTIRIWDAEIKDRMLGRLDGHRGAVTSVSFSPDGRRILSSSYDGTVRLWNAKTGEGVIGRLEGHGGCVTSASFSPDGVYIVSSSFDGTARIWETETGKISMGPLKGHTNTVTSASFSPDGRRVVSGSLDKTVRVWDATTAEIVIGPLNGHTGGVSSVSFSQDGSRIISGSQDKTIRVWNAEDGRSLIGPLEGHTAAVNMVSPSSDCRRIVSGSEDNTIRVWDMETGDLVIGPLEGHSSRVTSVSFSPDDKRIVSGSYDGTVRVWEVQTGETVMCPLEGHNNWVTSVSFSPDGRFIVSGAYDRTIRVWNLQEIDTSADIYSLFQYSPVTKDGWILGPNSELLLWIPPEIRPRLCSQGHALAIGGDLTVLDLATFAHGEAWSHCRETFSSTS